MKIVDGHLHMWDDDINRPWLSDIPSLNTAHLPPHLSSEESSSQDEVEAMVYVETDVRAEDSLLEAKWVVHKISDLEPRIKGVIAHAPVEQGLNCTSHLDQLLSIGKKDGKQMIKGVRKLIQSESTDFCVQPDFIHGVQIATEKQFSFDITCRPHHLENVIKMVDQCPNTSFVLDPYNSPTR
eukprot:TRINITY_DN3490_c0_g1_i2.p1 TRINITY_DN3490_c0_g1~~TRINITY_DN3490_c0_g1_i2.p1  ORF type:complete len:182 (-),score=33.23 TRINITY_DN3490_c0_g1_i2:803-1348(-)